MKTVMMIAAGITMLFGATLHAQTSTARAYLEPIGYRYALVQFAVDSPELTPMNERVIRDFIAPEIEKNARIGVIGYTDVVGLEPRNRQLSIQRAINVAKAIRKGLPKDRAVEITVRGVGEEAPIYDNMLPEGRFYNRTVVVTIAQESEK